MELRLYPDCISQSDYGEVELQRLKTENNWTQVNAYKNKMCKARNDILIQLIPSTANKFETLNNLEEDETICSTPKQEEYVSTIGLAMIVAQFFKQTKNPLFPLQGNPSLHY